MTSKLVLNAVGGDLEETIALVGGAEISAGAGEVVVDVEASPINGADPLFAMGWFGVYPEVPADMGAEGAGRVAEAGPGVDPALHRHHVARGHHGPCRPGAEAERRQHHHAPSDHQSLTFPPVSVNAGGRPWPSQAR